LLLKKQSQTSTISVFFLCGDGWFGNVTIPSSVEGFLLFWFGLFSSCCWDGESEICLKIRCCVMLVWDVDGGVCCEKNCNEKLDLFDSEISQNGEFFAGLDLAQTRDYTVFRS
jgi:hypothetical protein